MVDFRRALENQRAGRPAFARGRGSGSAGVEAPAEAPPIDWSATTLQGVLDRIVWPRPGIDEPDPRGVVIARLRSGASVKGSLFAPTPGQEYVFSAGRWEEGRANPKRPGECYDPTFVFKDAMALTPTTASGVRDYLEAHCSNVGPAVARAIVEAFGEASALDICKSDPARVAAKVRGINRARAQEIAAELVARAGIEAVEVDARGIVANVPEPGVTTRQLNAILMKYGAQAAEVLRRTPYALIEEIDGIGWKTADAIGRAPGVGIASEDPGRLRAGVLHAIQVAEDEGGHTCVETGSLLVAAVGLLLVDMGPVEARIAEMKAAGELVELEGVVARAEMFAAESAISAAFLRLLGPERIVVRRAVEPRAPSEDEADALAVEYEAHAASADARAARAEKRGGDRGAGASGTRWVAGVRVRVGMNDHPDPRDAKRPAKTPLEAWAASALASLAAMDSDHAAERNGAGFSKSDGARGHKWASAAASGSGPGLTEWEWAAAVRLACKYRRQVGGMPGAGARVETEEKRL